MPARFQGLKILDQIHDAIIASDLDGTITSWNAGAERLYGYSADEAVGANICMLHFPEDRPCIQSSVFDLLHDKDMVEIELRNRHKSGEEIFVDSRISALRDGKSRLVGHLSCSNNITVRLKAENALRSSREQLQHLVSSTPGLLYSCTTKYPFVPNFLGDNVEQVLTFSASELEENPELFVSRLHPEDSERVITASSGVLERGSILEEYRFRVRNGSYRWLRDSAKLVPGDGHRPPEIVGYCEDITEAKRIEETRLEQERLAAMEHALLTTLDGERRRFSRELHDNLNQELAAVLLDFAYLENNPKVAAKSLHKFLEGWTQRITRLTQLIHDMATQLHPSRLEHLGLDRALRGECSVLASRTGIAIEFHSASLPERFHPDEDLCLYRVAQECLRNIVQHSHATHVRIALQGMEGGAGMVIEDNGRGFDPDALPPDRLGIRSITERVRLAKGTLSLHSGNGHGTQVEVWIPISRASPAEDGGDAA
ncbi:MAG: PAS domain-containing protein [Bryobacterales bacterium]|nr:PAS domain-containing protein [Bryobacterales bacterium]